MREAIAFELHAAGGPFVNADANALTDAVLAVRDGEMERLRADLAARQLANRLLQRSDRAERRRAEEAEAERDEARATNQRLNLRCQQAEGQFAKVKRAVADWRINERGTYVPLSTLNAIAKAVGIEHDTDGWELHYQRVEALEAELGTERAHAQQAGIRIAELTALVAAQQQVIERQAREALAAATEPHTPRPRIAPTGPDGQGDGGGQ